MSTDYVSERWAEVTGSPVGDETMDWTEIAKFVAYADWTSYLTRIHWTVDGKSSGATIFSITDIPYIECYITDPNDDKVWSQNHQSGSIMWGGTGQLFQEGLQSYFVVTNRSDHPTVVKYPQVGNEHWITSIVSYGQYPSTAVPLDSAGGDTSELRKICAHAVGVKA